MKVVILCGGLGTRIAEYTNKVPKPMIPVGDRPIMWHIMEWYASHGHEDFYLALGYKSELIKEYFLQYRNLNNDFTVNLGTGQINTHKEEVKNWNVTLVDTGIKSMTGGRLKRLKHYIGNETFMLTYGDGISNLDINTLIDFHKSHGKMVTVTAVHPGARFGKLNLKGEKIISFQEKPQTGEGWVNGGFFVMEPEFINLIEDDETILELSPLEIAASKDEMRAFLHDGYWQCMDTVRDRENLEKVWQSGNAPWKIDSNKS